VRGRAAEPGAEAPSAVRRREAEGPLRERASSYSTARLALPWPEAGEGKRARCGVVSTVGRLGPPEEAAEGFVLPLESPPGTALRTGEGFEAVGAERPDPDDAGGRKRVVGALGPLLERPPAEGRLEVGAL